MPIKVNFTLLPIELENLEKFVDVKKYSNKNIKKIMLIIKTNSKVYKPKIYE